MPAENELGSDTQEVPEPTWRRVEGTSIEVLEVDGEEVAEIDWANLSC